MKHLLGTCLLVLLALAPARLQAQGLTPRPGPGMRGPQKKPTESPEGPAEAAPEGTQDEPELPALPPWPGQETKKLQLFQLEGYFRFRYDMFHKLSLGQVDEGGARAPFYTPISENSSSGLGCDARSVSKDLDDGCRANTLNSANMRLRLEPTINVAEMVRIHTQVDLFDNLVLGSNPDTALLDPAVSGDAALAGFTDSQAPPMASTSNSARASIVVKRAWAVVETPFGPLQFGRMPNHWGLGLRANRGDCWDCDHGDNVDRVMFSTTLFGHKFGMGYDINSNGPTTLSVDSHASYMGGQGIDLETLDDVDELFWIVGKMEPPDVVRDKIDRGQLVFNYGLYLTYRWQGFDYARLDAADAPAFSTTGANSASTWATQFIERDMWMVTPDLWFKLLWKKLYIEFEGLIIAGKIGNASDAIAEDSMDILQFGWALRSSYKFLKDSLHVGMEVGMASGDQAEPDNNDVNRRRWHPLGFNSRPTGTSPTRIDRDGALNEFRFDHDYHVDLIMFRHILGTVAGATYFKPWIQYFIVDSFGARLDMIYGLANEPVAFPGNSSNIGVELDLNIFYRNEEEKFFAGLQYGVMFPLGALKRPEELFGESFADGADIAHVLRLNMMVRF